MTTTTKPVPGYLKPSEFTHATARVVYEPPLAPGVKIRLGPDTSLEERTLRYQHCKTGEPMELVLPEAEIVEIVGLDEWEEKKYSQETHQLEPTGRMIPYAYSLWETEEPPHLGDYGAFQEYCEREGITDQEAFLKSDAGQNWLTGGHKIGDRRCFEIGRGHFHSALIGGEWIPVVFETVRTQNRPVLGWALKHQPSGSFRELTGRTRGHRARTRDARGRLFAESNVTRKRWTTTLDVRALEQLDAIAAESGLHRNEIVERLILGADAELPRIGITEEKAAAAVAPLMPAAGPEPDINADELNEAIERLCHQHGKEWPRGMASALSKRSGLTRQTIYNRRDAALKRIGKEEG